MTSPASFFTTIVTELLREATDERGQERASYAPKASN